MATVTNTDVHTRDWPHLQFDAEVRDADGTLVHAQGTTLRLAPGEQAEVVLPESFVDPYLKAVTRPVREKATPEPAITTPSKEGE